MAREARTRTRINWKERQGEIDLIEVAITLLGAPQEREKSGNPKSLYWRCPFHADNNPSLEINKKDNLWWNCRGCGAGGSAVDLVMKKLDLKFSPALQYLFSNPDLLRGEGSNSDTSSPLAESTSRVDNYLSKEHARKLVTDSEQFLQSGTWETVLGYLTGTRGLSLQTIKSARLGYNRKEEWVPYPDGRNVCCPVGWVIPCFEGGELTRVKIRKRFPDKYGKYTTVYGDRERFFCYPSWRAIHLGLPLIVTEGEFDCLLLTQLLVGRASVVTLGSVSSPSKRFLELTDGIRHDGRFISLDNDDAGRGAAEKWPPEYRRVFPPAFKDWGECREAGVDLGWGWQRILDGVKSPGVWKIERVRPPAPESAPEPPYDPGWIEKLTSGGLIDAPEVPDVLAPPESDPTRLLSEDEVVEKWGLTLIGE